MVNNKIDVASLGSGIKISGEYVNFPDGDAKAAFNFLNFNCKSVAEFDDDSDLTEIDANADNWNRSTSKFMERKRSISPLLATAMSIAMPTPFQLGVQNLYRDLLVQRSTTIYYALVFCDVSETRTDGTSVAPTLIFHDSRSERATNFRKCSHVSLSFW